MFSGDRSLKKNGNMWKHQALSNVSKAKHNPITSSFSPAWKRLSLLLYPAVLIFDLNIFIFL